MKIRCHQTHEQIFVTSPRTEPTLRAAHIPYRRVTIRRADGPCEAVAIQETDVPRLAEAVRHGGN